MKHLNSYPFFYSLKFRISWNIFVISIIATAMILTLSINMMGELVEHNVRKTEKLLLNLVAAESQDVFLTAEQYLRQNSQLI
jgi:hypothetical protein